MKRIMYKVLMAGCVLAVGVNLCRAQSPSPEMYKASTIPDSLKQEANSVVRYSYTERTLKGIGKLVEKYHEVITILNEKGDRNGVMQLLYNKFRSINSVNMIVYDGDGKIVKKYGKSDMYDRSATDGMSIITDDRVKYLWHEIATYPVTIEKIYETDANSYLDLGSWYIQDAETAVQAAEYVIMINPSLGFRYKNKNIAIKPEKTIVNGLDKYTWHVKNLKAEKKDEGTPDWTVLPVIDFAANNFSFDGLPGDISTWENYGRWQYKVNEDVCTLPPARIAEIQQLTAQLTSDKEKAKFLYEYIQHNMRYVSIQLGIGGLKPFPASFVDQKKYGDCKALTNYMYAMLKAVNIPSYYAMVNGGTNEEPADETFPSDPFNHIILCIPFKGDTTWLECTSNTKPFGKLGTFTENRKALLITENGGKLVNTPVTKAEDNVFNSTVLIKLNADGSAKTDIKISGTGEYRDMYLGLAQIPLDKQKEVLLRSMHIKQPSFFEFKPAEDKDGVKQVNIELEYDKFSDVITGSKQFYRPAAFDIWSFTCPAAEKRKADYYFDHPLQKNSVTTIELPDGFEVETLPATQSLKFSYGTFDVSYSYDAVANRVTGNAKFNLNKHVIPAAKYTEMQQYMDAVAKAQNKKLVIRRKA